MSRVTNVALTGGDHHVERRQNKAFGLAGGTQITIGLRDAMVARQHIDPEQKLPDPLSQDGRIVSLCEPIDQLSFRPLHAGGKVFVLYQAGRL